MTPCARCNDPSDGEILTVTGNIPVCTHCADCWFAMLAGQPIETFYGEVENG